MQVSKCHLSLETCVKAGAALSCLLFNIMIDDLEAAIFCLLFADDVVLWTTGSNIRPLEDALNSSLLNLATWANTNKMEDSFPTLHSVYQAAPFPPGT
ncbi:hypothetical protein TNIN_213391 [Trichonephila inaurata madagascariensis]|uniref:Reverse transcriptase domain-containing protein n=1 Tax=Trichonephila inaurata madagascariensis TaxID=2747483 RepID=A0A8X6YQ77_9ARAC|nr:hypothetical protein TNIN_213391 [Trichonephila inaurata madagascariensis]